MIVAVGMVRDEADIIETTVRHLFAEGVDRMIVADNLSSDATPVLLKSLAGEYPITVLDDPEPAYYQDRKMTALASLAAADDWVVPFDADEVWFSPDGRTIADVLASSPAAVVRCVGFDHVARGDSDGLSPWRRTGPQRFPKVAFRWCVGARLHMGNHGVDRPGPVADGLELRHFQYRSLEQMTRKLRNGRAAYEATVGLEIHGQHWREGGALTDDELAARWDALCSEEGLVFDPAPVRS